MRETSRARFRHLYSAAHVRRWRRQSPHESAPSRLHQSLCRQETEVGFLEIRARFPRVALEQFQFPQWKILALSRLARLTEASGEPHKDVADRQTNRCLIQPTPLTSLPLN